MENINKLNIYIGKEENQRLQNIDDVDNGIMDVEELGELIVGRRRSSLKGGLRRCRANKFIKKYGLSIYKKIN